MKWIWFMILFFSGCGNKETPEGQILKVDMGDTFIVSMKNNPTTAYEWYKVSLNPYLDSINRIYKSSGSTKAGAGGMDQWEFRAMKKGMDTLRFVQAAHPDEINDALQVKTYIVMIK